MFILYLFKHYLPASDPGHQDPDPHTLSVREESVAQATWAHSPA